MFSTAKAVIDSKLGRKPEPVAPGPRLRLGQVLHADPTPFILATGAKARRPSAGETTVTRIGRIERPVPLTRLHVSDGAFYQIHVAQDGTVDECRYFSKVDEVVPAGADEWDFWLADADGMVGYPVFETKDGARYGRISPTGEARVRPVRSTETVEALVGGGTISHEAMTYSRKLPDTDGVTEYLIVSVEKDDGGAFVGIFAGLDVSPVGIGL